MIGCHGSEWVPQWFHSVGWVESSMEMRFLENGFWTSLGWINGGEINSSSGVRCRILRSLGD